MAHIIFWNTNDTTDTGNVATRTIGSYRLANWLKLHGHTTTVIDFCHRLTTQQLIAITERYITPETIAIGVSTTFWYNWTRRVVSRSKINVQKDESYNYFEPPWVIEAREIVEARNPNINWLLGGAGVNDWTNFKREKTQRFEWQRFHGHSEDSLLKWMDEKSSKKFFAPVRPMFDICSAQGVFDPSHKIQKHEVLPMELARGCQFKCKFCRYPLLGRKKNTYIRSADLVREEFLYNYHTFGTTRYVMLDDTVNESEEKMVALAKVAQSLPFQLEWVGFLRLDLIGVRPYTIQVLKDAGLRSTFFGIESFNPQSAMMIGKGWIGTNGKDFLLRLNDEWKGHINYQLGFIVGLGQESEKELYETREWCINNIKGSWTFNTLSIFSNNHLIEFPSVFDLEHEKYGYKFPNPDAPWSWDNGYWTHGKALQVTHKLNDHHGSLTQVHAGFPLGLMASGGYSFDELMSTKINELNKPSLAKKVGDFLDIYVNQMLE